MVSRLETSCSTQGRLVVAKKVTLPGFVLAVDPGKISGVALVNAYETPAKLAWSMEVDEDHLAETIRPVLNWRFLPTVSTMTIVCENFIITPNTAKKSQAPWSLKMIGVLEQCCRDVGYPVEDIVMQTSSEARTFCNNAQLQAIGLWHRGGAGHANDAIRHAVLALARTGYKDVRMLNVDSY